MKSIDKLIKTEKTLLIAFVSLLINAIFCAYHIVLGALTHSWWLLSLGAYYVTLSIMRFAALRMRTEERRISTATGIILTASALPLAAIVALACTEDHGTQLNKIIMIAVAAYAFTKVTLASINLVRDRKTRLPRTRALRSVSFTDALVSIFSLQRSMLASFAGMSASEIKMMNLGTGIAVCLAVLMIGILLVKRENKNRNNGRRS